MKLMLTEEHLDAILLLYLEDFVEFVLMVQFPIMVWNNLFSFFRNIDTIEK